MASSAGVFALEALHSDVQFLVAHEPIHFTKAGIHITRVSTKARAMSALRRLFLFCITRQQNILATQMMSRNCETLIDFAVWSQNLMNEDHGGQAWRGTIEELTKTQLPNHPEPDWAYDISLSDVQLVYYEA